MKTAERVQQIAGNVPRVPVVKRSTSPRAADARAKPAYAKRTPCCSVAWDGQCVLSCINDCGGCDYDNGCFPNVLQAIAGEDGACSLDGEVCTVDEECAQEDAPADCVPAPALYCTATVCLWDDSAATLACDEEAPCPELAVCTDGSVQMSLAKR